jgi:putative intracellular protease/amidase
MADELAGKRVAFLVANEGVEQRELTEPWEAVRRAGGQPELLAPESGEVQCFEHVDRAGRTLTSRPGLKTDLHNAGASWVDEEVRVDGRLVSSRKPDDLPAFRREIVQVFAGVGAAS